MSLVFSSTATINEQTYEPVELADSVVAAITAALDNVKIRLEEQHYRMVPGTSRIHVTYEVDAE